MKCKNCNGFIPTNKEPYYEEYIALLETYHDIDTNEEEEKLFLDNFFYMFDETKEFCKCCCDEIESLKEKILPPQLESIKECKSLLMNNKELSFIISDLDTVTKQKQFLANEQKEISLQNKKIVITYMEELRESIKIWNEQKETDKIRAIKKTDVLVIYDFVFNDLKNYYDDIIFQIIKTRKIYDKTTYIIFNTEFKKKTDTIEKNIRNYSDTVFKWFVRNKNKTYSLKMGRGKIVLKQQQI